MTSAAALRTEINVNLDACLVAIRSNELQTGVVDQLLRGFYQSPLSHNPPGRSGLPMSSIFAEEVRHVTVQRSIR